MEDGKTKEIKLKRKPKREDVKSEIKEQTVKMCGATRQRPPSPNRSKTAEQSQAAGL